MNRTDKLRHEAIFALAGADYVRAKLVELLNTGPENLASHVYAVKCRVKDEGSLIRKVLFKRTEERKKSYSPSSATDIVGLRLLALSNERLPLIVERFIDFISFCQSPNIALFAGSALSHAVKEVKIYKSENNPVVYDQIYSFFSEKDFGDDSKKPIIELTQSTKDDPYSSVHIVCRANSHYQRNPKEIPVEIQIRTVFEDAWAEIDHPLRYKGASYLSRNRSERYSDLKKTADKFLGDLKKSVDQCLHFTDDIQNLYSRISRTFGRRTTPSVVRFTPSGVRVAYDETVLRATPPQIRSEFENSETNIELLTRKSMDQRRYAANLRLCNRILTSLDLPLNFHPVAIRASANVTPFGVLSVPA